MRNGRLDLRGEYANLARAIKNGSVTPEHIQRRLAEAEGYFSPRDSIPKPSKKRTVQELRENLTVALVDFFKKRDNSDLVDNVCTTLNDARFLGFDGDKNYQAFYEEGLERVKTMLLALRQEQVYERIKERLEVRT